jgi:hypothetical protein
MSNCNTAACTNITAGFIDLASYDELEKYLYGCGEALSYFVRTTCKSTWFTQVPVILQLNSGTPDFGQTWSVKVSRQGDYLLQTWLRVCLPNIQVYSGADPALGLRWTRNLMHNLVKEVCFTANDMVVAKFNSTLLLLAINFLVLNIIQRQEVPLMKVNNPNIPCCTYRFHFFIQETPAFLFRPPLYRTTK